ncbi:uncharacterized protein BYT42DRAFT_609060 [Radiomyces spectabilis]|uniref:uncharacterized protein n=1 Tax=Radiomyces spectabilis TaxID=64574 RepID=UPI00221E830B|nr:uncharacterized protein BYT42DRAFT_609060 [Radiomyces spectabilis]KAI8393260.1 hypothetical protein BYT42DRAFT_609060 [Radiomyces spectabilis]
MVLALSTLMAVVTANDKICYEGPRQAAEVFCKMFGVNDRKLDCLCEPYQYCAVSEQMECRPEVRDACTAFCMQNSLFSFQCENNSLHACQDQAMLTVENYIFGILV